MTQSKALIIVIVMSLALNLFLVGYLFGDKTRGHFKRPPHFGFSMKDKLNELSPERQEQMRPYLKQTKKQLRQNKRNMHQHRKALEELFSKENINEEAIKHHFMQLQILSNNSIMLTQENMLQIMQQLTPDERKKMMQKHQPHPPAPPPGPL